MYDYCTDVEYHITKAEDSLEYLNNAKLQLLKISLISTTAKC